MRDALNMKKIKIFTDGGSRGNPGPAAIGVVLIDAVSSGTVFEISKSIGSATNNIAEYSAVEVALDWVISEKDNSITELDFYLDSQLVQRQLTGQYKVKDPVLRQIFLRIREKIIECGASVNFTHIGREQNARADALVNKALDTVQSSQD